MIGRTEALEEAQILILSVEGRCRAFRSRDIHWRTPDVVVLCHMKKKVSVWLLCIMSSYVFAVPNLGSLNRGLGHVSGAYDYIRK